MRLATNLKVVGLLRRAPVTGRTSAPKGDQRPEARNRRYCLGSEMNCANPKCGAVMQEMHGGTMRMLELEVPPEERIARSEWGFPILCVPTRYVWLCASCSRVFKLLRWTADGLILEPRLVDCRPGKLPLRIPTKQPGAVRRFAYPMAAGKSA